MSLVPPRADDALFARVEPDAEIVNVNAACLGHVMGDGEGEGIRVRVNLGRLDGALALHGADDLRKQTQLQVTDTV